MSHRLRAIVTLCNTSCASRAAAAQSDFSHQTLGMLTRSIDALNSCASDRTSTARSARRADAFALRERIQAATLTNKLATLAMFPQFCPNQLPFTAHELTSEEYHP